jgi:hypothetical protein
VVVSPPVAAPAAPAAAPAAPTDEPARSRGARQPGSPAATGLSTTENARLAGPRLSPDEDNWAYCRKCAIVTPPRAMHCFLCNRCVLGMDHHCPWLATCIGYHNHSYFFLFLFYVSVGCLYLCLFTIPLFYSVTVRRRPQDWSGVRMRRDRFAITLLGVLPMTFVVCVGAMMLWHAIVLACGATSLEAVEVFRWLRDVVSQNGPCRWFCRRFCGAAPRQSEVAGAGGASAGGAGKPTVGGRYAGSGVAAAEAGRPQFRHEFDQGGMVANWKEQFGVRGYKLWWFWWCMPIPHRRAGNGIDRFVVPDTGVGVGNDNRTGIGGGASRAGVFTV